MSVLERATLEESTLADLHAIASELGLDGYRRLRKSDLIDALIEKAGGEVAAAQEAEAEERDGEERASATPRRRGRRGGRGRGSAERGADEPKPDEEPTASDEPEADEPRPSRRRSGSGRGSRGGRGGAADAPDAQREERHDEREQPIAEGVVELLANGSGFLRVSPAETSDEDVYISAAQVKRCELISGDKVSGPRRAPHRSERYPSLVRIDLVNGRPAAELADRARFDDLPAVFPAERFKFGSEDETLKVIEFLTPFGRGSRVTICGDHWAGKSYTLRKLAEVLAAGGDATVLLALAGVRPEEIGEWAGGPVVPGSTVSFTASADAQDNAVELVVDQARRLAARGENAIVLIDTLDGLHPLSAHRALAAARNIADGGSLTVIATSAQPLGWETTVISLDAKLASAGRYPAVDMATSGTLRPELLVGQVGAKAIAKERAKLLK